RLIAPVISSEEGQSAETPGPEASTAPTRAPSLVPALDTWLQTPKLRPLDGVQDRRGGQAPDVEIAREQGRRRPQTWLFAAWVSVAILCVLAVLTIWGWRRTSSVSHVSQRKALLAVLPFDNLSRDPDQEFFSDGLTEELIAQVGKLNRYQLKVVARSSVAK